MSQAEERAAHSVITNFRFVLLTSLDIVVLAKQEVKNKNPKNRVINCFKTNYQINSSLCLVVFVLFASAESNCKKKNPVITLNH